MRCKAARCGAALPVSANNSIAAQAGVASKTCEKTQFFSAVCTCQAQPCFCTASTRWPQCTCPPAACTARAAACGSKAPKSRLGSKKSAPLGNKNIASRSTRKNTCALASCTAVFSADKHSGVMNCACTTGGKFCVMSASVKSAAQRKPLACQRPAQASSANLSRQRQPLAPKMPSSAFQGAGKSAKRRPVPSARCKLKGMRKNAALSSRPKLCSKASVSA